VTCCDRLFQVVLKVRQWFLNVVLYVQRLYAVKADKKAQKEKQEKEDQLRQVTTWCLHWCVAFSHRGMRTRSTVVYTLCLQKLCQLWKGIAQNYKHRFWWHLAQMFKRLYNRVCMFQFSYRFAFFINFSSFKPKCNWEFVSNCYGLLDNLQWFLSWSLVRLVRDSVSLLALYRVTTFQTTWNSLTFPLEAGKDYPVSIVYRYGQQSLFHIAPAEKRVLEYLELEKTHLISLPLTFSIFPDFSLTTVEFPDFSRFSRWVVTLKSGMCSGTTTAASALGISPPRSIILMTMTMLWLQDREEELRSIAIQMRQRERERRHKEREEEEESGADTSSRSRRDLDRRRPRSRSRSRSGSRSRSYKGRRLVYWCCVISACL